MQVKKPDTVPLKPVTVEDATPAKFICLVPIHYQK
jgi:hypothetical protein